MAFGGEGRPAALGWVVPTFLACLLASGLAAAADAAAGLAAPSKPACRVDAGLVTVSTPASGAEPLIVIYERDPWLTAVGSDFPTVVLYEDGRVLFAQGDRRTARIVSGSIEPRAAVGLRDQLVTAGFMEVAPDTNCAPGVSDMRTVQVILRRGTAWKVASAYGLGRDGSCDEARPAKALLDAYARLLKLQPADAKPFEPEEIDVMIWGFEYARGKPIPWPAGVPAPPADVVPQQDAPYSPRAYHHVLPVKFEPQIEKLLRAMGGRAPPRAMLLNGHKWSVVPRWLWPGSRVVEDVVNCAYKNRAVREPRDDE